VENGPWRRFLVGALLLSNPMGVLPPRTQPSKLIHNRPKRPISGPMMRRFKCRTGSVVVLDQRHRRLVALCRDQVGAEIETALTNNSVTDFDQRDYRSAEQSRES